MDTARIRTALTPTIEGLDAAGFDLETALEGERLRLRVVARPTACEDCLVPKSMFRRMALDELQAGGLSFSDLDVQYPIDARRS